MNPLLDHLLSPDMLVSARLVCRADPAHMVDGNRIGSTDGVPSDWGKSLL
jgi:hypothetical protein